MIKTNFNPIHAMSVTLGIWLLFMLLIIPAIAELSGADSSVSFGCLLWGLCLAPSLCFIVFNLFIILKKSWSKKNWIVIIIVEIILILFIYDTLSAIINRDLSLMWIFSL